jgi:methylenetetrahydrofolate reductase (NADPH)
VHGQTLKARQRDEGIRICVEIIQQVREIEGVHGVHLMAYRPEEAVAEIIERAGLLPRSKAEEEICEDEPG